MAKSYLTLTNELLRELNEVILTSSNFSSAIGIQAHAKDCINRAYLDMVTEEPKWPFLATGESGATDPMYGNVSVDTVAGTRWYELKAASSDATGDYGAIEWDNFYITTVGVSGESAPYVSQNLSFFTAETWKDFRRTRENSDDADAQNHGQPNAVIRSPDGRNFGLSPIPDKVYKVWFFAYDLPTELSAHGDTIVFPDLYSTTLMAKARYFIHQFKENPQAAAFALDDYKKGLRSMRENLLGPSTAYFKDDRMVFV
mgnify:FL=1|jgi:hypothetical protein|tara:strand:+ start:510 stop:1280 length:771 start_codon:yes stop_codon:yes gene_type:complete